MISTFFELAFKPSLYISIVVLVHALNRESY